MCGDSCKICGEEIDLKGRRSICSRKHFYRCPVCGELVDIKVAHDLRNISIRGFEYNNIRVLLVDDELCIFDYIVSEDKTIYDYCCNNCQSLEYIKLIKKEFQQIRSIKTCNKNYGVDYPMQSEDIRKKSELSCLINYGVTHPLKCKMIQDKVKSTMNKNYGVDYPMQSEEIMNKINSTIKENYGVDNPSQSEEIKKKKEETCYNNYGVKHPLQSKKIRSKHQETVNKNYGVKYPMQSSIIQDKFKATCLNNWGTEYPNQNPFILKKHSSKGSLGIRTKLVFSDKEIITRSWWETVFALYLHYNNIVFLYEELSFDFIFNDKKHIYIPDFYLPEFDYIVEIKGYQRDPDSDKVAWKSVIDAGYGFEVIRSVEFIEGWLNSNSDIDLSGLRASSRECDSVFVFSVG